MKKHFNYHLFFLAVFLVACGLFFLACLSSLDSLQKFGTTNYYLLHQLLYGLLPAVVLGFIAFRVPLNFIKKVSPVILLLNIVVLLFVFLPKIGLNFWGAQRWLSLGFVSFQPSEFLKITAILYLSAWISAKLYDADVSGFKPNVKKGYHNAAYVLFPFIIFLSIISVILLFQPDLSTLGIIGLTLLAMYFSCRTPLWHTFLIITGAVSSLLLLIKFEPYRLDRWFIFLNPEQDPLGKGFQLRQSLISLGSGGIFGKGFGMSAQKFGFMPQAIGDSAFAILGEEFGLIGGLVLIGLFIYLFWLGIKIVKSSNDRFSKLTAMGITFWITLQALINLASVSGIFPLSGIPLPFFSYGGSHLTTELIGIGLLLNISKNS